MKGFQCKEGTDRLYKGKIKAVILNTMEVSGTSWVELMHQRLAKKT